MQSDCLGLAPLLGTVAMVAVAAAGEVALGVEVAELVERSGQWSGQLALQGALLLLPTPTELPTETHYSNSGSTMTPCVRLTTHWK